MSTQTRTRLLRAARRLFARNGYHATSLDDIAAAAGLTKGAVYSQFAGKLNIMMDLVGLWSRETVVALAESRGQGAVESLLATSRARTQSEQMLVEAWRLAVDEPAVRDVVSAEIRRIERALASAIGGPAARAEAAEALEVYLGSLAARALGLGAEADAARAAYAAGARPAGIRRSA